VLILKCVFAKIFKNLGKMAEKWSQKIKKIGKFNCF
jgi:hypothetical protein